MHSSILIIVVTGMNIFLKKNRARFWLSMLLGLLGSGLWGTPALGVSKAPAQSPLERPAPPHGSDVQGYLEFFEKVYDTMEENYYLPISRPRFEKFVEKFEKKIYPQLRRARKTNQYIKWRSAAYMVDYLRSREDAFSAFYPPKPAKSFQQEVLGKRIDLGIEGQGTPEGYIVLRLEPRSDSYQKGMRVRDIIRRIDNQDVTQLTDEDIKDRLNPLEGTTVIIVYWNSRSQTEETMEVTSREYFKQTVFMKPVEVPHVYCLHIDRFNQKTSEDMLNYLVYIEGHSPESGLILDLRGNPGGPPLAAREISSFFLTAGEDFAYFQKRGRPKSLLKIPRIPQQYYYEGPIVILVDKESGSASELFSGIMQSRGRAVLMGTNTAGKVFLKSMFNFDDESMLLLVTGRGYYPDGGMFSFDGVTPDEIFIEVSQEGLIEHAAQYLTGELKFRK